MNNCKNCRLWTQLKKQALLQLPHQVQKKQAILKVKIIK